MEPGFAVSGPAYFAASPDAADAVHLPCTGVGYLASHAPHATSCGIFAQSPVALQSYGVVASLHVVTGQS